jgi:thioesterase domain-containing protein
MRQYLANPMQAAAFNRYQAAPAVPGANTQVSISFGESVNTEFLRHAWQAVIQRHPILRSAFSKTIDGVTVREADKGENFWIPLDWQSIPLEGIPSKWNDLLISDAAMAFEPVAIPLLRFHEIRLPRGEGHYLLTAPAFLLDEFSLTRVLLDLLLTLGQSPLAPVAALPESIKPKGWSEFLAGATAPLDFEPRGGNGLPVRAGLLLPREKTTAFSKFCHDHDLEEGLVIRSLWSLLLRRFGATGNVMLTLFDGRGESTEAGYYENRLPVVQNWTGSVRDWLAASQTLSDTMSEQVWIDPDDALRTAGAEFLTEKIPTSFAWHGSSINDIINTALPRWINFDAQIQQTTPRGLVLEARPGPRLELTLSGPFSTEAVAKDNLSRLAGLLTTLPDYYSKPVNKLPVLMPEEIRTLREWSRGPESPQEPLSVVDAFRQVVARRGDAVAVKFGDYGMTYSELDALSDKLAAYLVEAGFAGGWHAGLFLAPSAWICVALLGTWKAGNSCLALDPTAPAPWVDSTLAAHDVAVVICDGSSAANIDPSQRRRIIIDQDWESLESTPLERKTIQPDLLAASVPGHVDGAPPLVRALTHGMLVSAATEGARVLRFGEQDTFLVHAMPGGGAFFDEWLIPLLSGGTARVAEDELLDSATAAVTHLRLTAAEWANQAAAWQAGSTPASSTLCCVAIEGGVPLATALAIWDSQLQPRIRQVVFFSPAGLCGMGLASEARREGPLLPLGKPTAECEIFIVDGDGLDVPTGYSGRVFMKFPCWKNLPGCTGRHGVDMGLQGWRDEQGDVTLESSSQIVSSLPSHRQRMEAQPFFSQALDVFSGDAAVYVLSETPVAGAVSVKEWLLTRAGWIDEGALPKQQSLANGAASNANTAMVAPRSSPAVWVPLVKMSSGGSGDPLVLVHPADGFPEAYSLLLEALGSSRRVIGVLARGARNPESCHPSVESAAAQYIAALLEEEGAAPFQLAGFGFGGIVALEMARQLQAAGRPVPRIVLIGAVPPPLSGQPQGWIASMKMAFKRRPADGRMEPNAPATATAEQHEEAWKNFRFPTSSIPATVVLPADLEAEACLPWRTLLPEAVFEITKSRWSEMLAMPSVKRLASILNSTKSLPDPS